VVNDTARALARRLRSAGGGLWQHATARVRAGSDAADASTFSAPIPPRRDDRPAGPTVLLLNDCRDQDNFGAAVLVDGLIEILSRRLPTSEILPIPSHWVSDARHGLGGFRDGGAGMHQPKAKFPALADQFETVADDWLHGGGGPGAAEFLDRIRRSDVVVLNGEGSLYRDNLSAIRELFLAWLAKERLDIPTVFVNGMVHLTGVMPILPAMVRKTFRGLDAVTVRDPCSLRNLAEYAPEVRATLVADSAFAIGPEAARNSASAADVLARVGGSSFFCFDPGAMPIDHTPTRRSALFELIVRLKGLVGQAVLVSSAPADEYIGVVADETDSVYVDSLGDYQEFMALAQRAELLVSGRYHNPILAAIVGCPSIALASSSHKVHGTCEMLDGLIGTPFDGTDLRSCFEAIEATAARLLERRSTLRIELQELCERRRAEAHQLGDVVAAALGSRGLAP
jgi:polysaccharide pyruvyl transferase WcaK-like protein